MIWLFEGFPGITSGGLLVILVTSHFIIKVQKQIVNYGLLYLHLNKQQYIMPKTIVNGKLTAKNKNGKSSNHGSKTNKNNNSNNSSSSSSSSQKNNIKAQVKPFFIDATNLCYWKDTSAPTINVLLELLIALRENGKKTFYCIFDANTQYKIPEYERKIYKSLLEHKNFFYQVTGGKRADDFILELADAYQSPVISNDNYNDPKYSKYKWKDRDFLPQRLFMGEVIPVLGNHHLIISELNVHKTLNKPTKELYDHLLQLLYPKISRQQGQIKFFNSQEGWGRILYEVDIYFHKNSFNKEREVEEGLDVEFTIQENEKGIFADDIAFIIEEDLEYFSGILESYDEQKSRGIVKIDNRKERLFFYKSYFEDISIISRLTKGQRVEFTIGNNKNGRCAKNIRILAPDWEIKVEKLETTLTQAKAMVKARDKTIEQYKQRLVELTTEKKKESSTVTPPVQERNDRDKDQALKHKSTKKQHKQRPNNRLSLSKKESTVSPSPTRTSVPEYQKSSATGTSSFVTATSKVKPKPVPKKIDLTKSSSKPPNIPASQQLETPRSPVQPVSIPPSQQLEETVSASPELNVRPSQRIETPVVQQETAPVVPPSQQIEAEVVTQPLSPSTTRPNPSVTALVEQKRKIPNDLLPTKDSYSQTESKSTKKWTIIGVDTPSQPSVQPKIEQEPATTIAVPESIAVTTDDSVLSTPKTIKKEPTPTTEQEDTTTSAPKSTDTQVSAVPYSVVDDPTQEVSKPIVAQAKKPEVQKTRKPEVKKTRKPRSQKSKKPETQKASSSTKAKHTQWWNKLETEWQKAFNVVLNKNESTDCPEDAAIEKLFKIKKLSFYRTSRNKLSFKLSSVSGLQYLTNLTQLNISQHQLTDLQDLAKLNKLVFLNCGSNQLTHLKGIPGLASLKELNCSRNQLTFADIENITQELPKLEKFDCRNNQLSKAEKEQVAKWELRDVKA